MTNELLYTDKDIALSGGLFTFLSAFLFIIIIFTLVMYLLQAFAMMKMADNLGIENSWLAFIPIANYWIYGELVSEKLGGEGGKKVLIVMVASLILSFIPVIGWVVSAGVSIFSLVLAYWLLSRYSENAVIWFVVSFITGFIAYPIILFALRNNKARY